MSRTPTAAVRWRAVIDDFHRSGLKQAEFCRRRGLSLHTFRKYLYGSPPAAAVARVRPAKGIFKAGQQPAMIALPRLPRSAPDAQTILTSR
jgi:hypothetical protein